MTALDIFFASPDLQVARQVRHWRIERAEDTPDIVYARLTARDGEEYRLLLLCDGYDQTAPSVVFVDESGNKMNPHAWPHGSSAFTEIVKAPPNAFLCTGTTREGLHHHANWRGTQDGWSAGRTLYDVLAVVQSLLDSPSYEGRG